MDCPTHSSTDVNIHFGVLTSTPQTPLCSPPYFFLKGMIRGIRVTLASYAPNMQQDHFLRNTLERQLIMGGDLNVTLIPIPQQAYHLFYLVYRSGSPNQFIEQD